MTSRRPSQCPSASVAAILAVASSAACGRETYEVEVGLPGERDRAISVEVFLLRSCPEAELLGEEPEEYLRKVVVTGLDTERLGAVDSGQYALYGRALGHECDVYAAGCQQIHLARGGTGVLRVDLSPVNVGLCSADQACDDGVCVAIDGGSCSPPCAADQVCDHGVCVPTDGGSCSPPCAADQVCDHGVCVPIDAGPDGCADACSDAGCDSPAPRILSTVPVPGHAMHVAVAGDLAYVANGRAGLTVIDVSMPAAPVVETTTMMGQRALDVALVDGFALVANDTLGLRVVDLSDPRSPVVRGAAETGANAIAVAAVGTTAYVAAHLYGVYIVDFANADAPSVVGTLDTTGVAYAIAVEDGYAYVAEVEDGVEVFDLSNPDQPVATILTDSWAQDVAVTTAGGRTWVLIAAGSDLVVVDVTDPTSPLTAATRDLGDGGWAVDVAVAGDLALLASDLRGLLVVDISNTADPFVTGEVEVLPGQAFGVAASNEHALVAADTAGLFVVDVSDPAELEVTATLPTPGFARGVASHGPGAVVVPDRAGVLAIDASDPGSPTVDPFVLATEYSVGYGVAMTGDYAVVAAYWRLSVIDVDRGRDVGGIETFQGGTVDVAIGGDNAFVANQVDGLLVVNIADPTQPELVATVGTVGDAEGVAVTATHAFVATTEGVVACDVSDPGAVTCLDVRHVTAGAARDVEVSGDVAFASWTNAGEGEAGIDAVDVSNPADPTLLDSLAWGGQALGLCSYGHRVLVARGEDGLTVIDVSNPADLRAEVTVDTPGRSQRVAASGTLAFVADGIEGLQVVDLGCLGP